MRPATLLTFVGVIWASTAWAAAQADKAALVGVVVDGKGQPVVDAGFAGGASGLGDRFAYTDSNGTVCLGAVAIGKYLLGFDADPQPMVPDNAIEVEVTAKGAPADLIVSR